VREEFRRKRAKAKGKKKNYVSQSWTTLGVTVLIAVVASDGLTSGLNNKVWGREAMLGVKNKQSKKKLCWISIFWDNRRPIYALCRFVLMAHPIRNLLHKALAKVDSLALKRQRCENGPNYKK
jgi:hypothetical protein